MLVVGKRADEDQGAIPAVHHRRWMVKEVRRLGIPTRRGTVTGTERRTHADLYTQNRTQCGQHHHVNVDVGLDDLLRERVDVCLHGGRFVQHAPRRINGPDDVDGKGFHLRLLTHSLAGPVSVHVRVAALAGVETDADAADPAARSCTAHAADTATAASRAGSAAGVKAAQGAASGIAAARASENQRREHQNEKLVFHALSSRPSRYFPPEALRGLAANR